MLRAIIASVLLLLASGAEAQKRVALVIGNSAYQHTGRLANPKNDAADMAAALKTFGFVVVEGLDLDKASFDRKVHDFARSLAGADAGVLFYAGHGLQVAGRNYLVPVDAKAELEALLHLEMVRVDDIQRVMEASSKTNVLFLDACRDNPLARNLARAMGTRSVEIGRGLAQTQGGVGTLISFSTQPGNVALDGTGRNSPYSAALARQLASSTDDLSAMLIAVRTDVVKVTQGKQVPWEHSALMGRFYFNPAGQTALPGPPSEAAEAWRAVEQTTSVPALEVFIARYGATFYAELARARIEELKKATGKNKTAVTLQPSLEPKQGTPNGFVPAEADRAAIGKRFATGSRAGSDVTVTYAQGVDSKLVFAEGTASTKDNEDHCQNGQGYRRGSAQWKTCMAETLKHKFTVMITANCALGTVKFTSYDPHFEHGPWLLPERSKTKSADCQAPNFWIVEGKEEEEVSWQAGVKATSAFQVLCPTNSKKWFLADKQC